jgi:hypothetical protein
MEKVDVYSFGLVCYEIVSGKQLCRPFIFRTHPAKAGWTSINTLRAIGDA